MLNKDLFYISLPQIAEALTTKSTVLYEIDLIYNKDKILFYSTAKEHPLYSDDYLTNGTLERELNIKKVLGVLLVAENNDPLRVRLLKILTKYFPEWYDLVIKKPRDFSEIHQKKMFSMGISADWMINNSYYRIPYYLIRLINGLDFAPLPQFRDFIDNVEVQFSNILQYQPFTSLILKEIKSEEVINFCKTNEKLFQNFKNCKDINLFLDVMDGINPTVTRFMSDPDYLKMGILQAKKFVTSMFEIQGLNSTLITNNISLSRSELRSIFTAMFVMNNWNIDILKKMSTDAIIQYYIFGVYFQTILNEYKNAKHLSRENSRETQFLELHNLGKEIAKLKKQIEALENEKRSLSDTLVRVKKENNLEKVKKEKEVHGINKPIQIENAKLKEDIKNFKSKEQELNKLREYIYSQLSGIEIREEPFQTQKLPADKKIVLVGGHLNWLKKVKEKFPSLIILDGTNPNQDFGIIENSDFLVFHTSHMDHATWNKIMASIDKKNIPYSFTSSQNLDLFSNQLFKALMAEKMIS